MTRCQARALDCRCAAISHVKINGHEVHSCEVCHAGWAGTYGEHDFDPKWLPFSLRLSRHGGPQPQWIA